MFVAVINKANEEMEVRYNNTVDDLEKVVNEVYKLSSLMEGGDRKSGTDW